MNTTPNLLSSDPSIAAACKAFAIPDRAPASPQELDCLSKGRHATVSVGGDDVAFWTFGKGPRILLMHGWCSRGSHLAGFVKPLLDAGFSVVLFDAPAHGESAGAVSSMIHAGRAALAIASHLDDVAGVIAHSAGSTAALWAFTNGLSVGGSVHISGPTSLTQVVMGTARAHGLDQKQTQAFRDWAQAFVGVPLDSVDLPALTARLSHPGLIIHDTEDRIVTVAQSLALHGAWSTSGLVTTTGLGHRRILGDAGTVENAVEFLKNHV